jgi:hypothetical protein
MAQAVSYGQRCTLSVIRDEQVIRNEISTAIGNVGDRVCQSLAQYKAGESIPGTPRALGRRDSSVHRLLQSTWGIYLRRRRRAYGPELYPLPNRYSKVAGKSLSNIESQSAGAPL